ncbi:MAG: hypothetical protein HPY61_01665 [Methanotrichaceae archaeon]|nr:hypothetical protein [Methanotrichaceae archaeon]
MIPKKAVACPVAVHHGKGECLGKACGWYMQDGDQFNCLVQIQSASILIALDQIKDLTTRYEELLKFVNSLGPLLDEFSKIIEKEPENHG